MPYFGDKKYWVGHHQTRGVIVVDCSTIGESDSFPVYFYEHKRIATCKRSIMRKFCNSTAITMAVAEDAYRAYIALVSFKEIREKNRSFLAGRGIGFSGIREAKESPRGANCWNCSKVVVNDRNFECVRCGWLICGCGACGCPKIKAKYTDPHKYEMLYEDFEFNDDISQEEYENIENDYSETESWTETSDSWVRSDEEGWYYEDDD